MPPGLVNATVGSSGKGKEKALDHERPGKGSNLTKKVLKRALSLQSLHSDERPVKKGTSFPLGMRPLTPSFDTPCDTEVTAASLEYEANWRRQRQRRRSGVKPRSGDRGKYTSGQSESVPETASDKWVALRYGMIFSHACIIDQ
jgi:hypothetical protein